LARADAAILLEEDQTGVALHIGARLPVLEARLAPAPQAPDLARQRIFAFAGIGRPGKFFTTLRDLGAELAGTRAFPDHHPYRPAEIDDLRDRARALDARLITTEKDRLRLPGNLGEGIAVLPVEVAWQDPQALDRLLARLPAHG